jgi:hypothetical protein
MGDEKTLIAASLCAAVSFALVFKWRRNRNRLPHPPGPKGYPIIGNTLDLARNVPIWQAFMPLAQKFGKCSFCVFREDTRLKILSTQDTDVLYLKLMTEEVVVLNSSEAISDLIDKRSGIYSDRVSPAVNLYSGSH